MKNLLFLLLFLPLMAVSQTADKKLLVMREFTVKEGHASQFSEGMKMWKACYLENGGTNKWNMWRRLQGKSNVYVMTGVTDNWAELDKDNPVGNSCTHIIQNFISPHIESRSYNIAHTMPERSSKTTMEGRTKVEVHNFRTNNGSEFNLIAEELTNNMRKVNGDLRGSWYDVHGGDRDAPHYFVSVSHMNFAGMDNQGDNIWLTYEKEHGKKKADELRARWRACITDYWSYVYSLIEDMSNL
jgi:hypothetical protein